MSAKKFKAEEVIRHNPEADVMLPQGVNVADLIRKLGVNRIPYYRLRRDLGDM